MGRSLNPGSRKFLRTKSEARRHVNVARAEANKNKPKKSYQVNEPVQNQNPSPIDLNQVEFHRHGLALVPILSDKRPGVAYLLKETANQPDVRICSCSIAKRQTCPHIL